MKTDASELVGLLRAMRGQLSGRTPKSAEWIAMRCAVRLRRDGGWPGVGDRVLPLVSHGRLPVARPRRGPARRA